MEAWCLPGSVWEDQEMLIRARKGHNTTSSEGRLTLSPPALQGWWPGGVRHTEHGTGFVSTPAPPALSCLSVPHRSLHYAKEVRSSTSSSSSSMAEQRPREGSQRRQKAVCLSSLSLKRTSSDP
ncbi:uncharacterized protein LOC135107413 [Scylla paramamosain]|uniref:uncharacterized protein LOC135107413 n=1 Tax=Scylla paramamosain TaxID=85552 RepID=UPI003083D250